MAEARISDERVRKAREDSIRALREGSVDERRDAAAILAELGTTEIEDLTKGLSDPDYQVRALVARALGGLAARSAVPILMEALDDPHWKVRANAVRSLASLATQDEVDEILLRIASDSNPVVRDAVREMRQCAADSTKRAES